MSARAEARANQPYTFLCQSKSKRPISRQNTGELRLIKLTVSYWKKGGGGGGDLLKLKIDPTYYIYYYFLFN